MDEIKQTLPEQRENAVAGTVGAFLFSLVGGLVWYLLYQIGFMAGISGIVGVICAFKGYEIFAKKMSKKGIVISIVMAVLVMVLAWYLCFANDLYIVSKEWYENGEVEAPLTFFEAVANAYLWFEDTELLWVYGKDLLIGLGLCAVGAFSTVRVAMDNLNSQAAETAESPATESVEVVMPGVENTETSESRTEETTEE